MQQITFSISFRNVDAADPRCGNETELTFGGIWYDENEGEPKDAALLHVVFNVIGIDEVVKEFGKLHPIPKTFKLISIHTPSDQGFR